MNSTIVEIANAVIQPDVRVGDWHISILTVISPLLAVVLSVFYTNYSLNKRDDRFLAREEKKELQATLDTANYYAQNIDLLLTDMCVFYNSKRDLSAVFAEKEVINPHKIRQFIEMSQEAHKHLASISDKIIKCYFRMTFNFNFLNDGIGHVKVEGEKFNREHEKYISKIATGDLASVNDLRNEFYITYEQKMNNFFGGNDRVSGLYNQTMKTFRDAFFFLALLQWKGEKKGFDLDINQNGKSYFPDGNLQYLQTEEFKKSFGELKITTDWITFSYEDLLHAYVHNKNNILGSLERN